MAIEIEHKYLVIDRSFRHMASSSVSIRQGYLSTDPERVVRVRTRNEKGYITVKGITEGDRRLEFEYEIPLHDALQMLELCPHTLEKRRWIVPYGSYTWEVDEFGGRLKGLILAEIELPASDTDYPLPPFVGENVTDTPRYYNSVLSQE